MPGYKYPTPVDITPRPQSSGYSFPTGSGGQFMGMPIGNTGYSYQSKSPLGGETQFATAGDTEARNNIMQYLLGMSGVKNQTNLGYDQNATQRYGFDTNRDIAGIQAGAQNYGSDNSLLGQLAAANAQKYGYDRGAQSTELQSRYGLLGNSINAATQNRGNELDLLAQIFGANAAQFGAREAANANRYGAGAGLLASQYGADADTDQARIGAEAQLGTAGIQNIPALANLGFKNRVFDELTQPLVGQLFNGFSLNGLGSQGFGGGQLPQTPTGGGGTDALIQQLLGQVISPEESQRRLQAQYGRNQRVGEAAGRGASERMTGGGFSSRSPALAAIQSMIPFHVAQMDTDAANSIPQADRQQNIGALAQAIGARDSDLDRQIALLNAQTGRQGVNNQVLNSILGFAGSVT